MRSSASCCSPNVSFLRALFFEIFLGRAGHSSFRFFAEDICDGGVDSTESERETVEIGVAIADSADAEPGIGVEKADADEPNDEYDAVEAVLPERAIDDELESCRLMPAV